MKIIKPVLLILLVSVAATIALVSAEATQETTRKMTKEDVDRLMTELSNWGRWGKDDQLGAVNMITDAKRKQAAALVKEGFPISLARDTETERAADNPSPYEHTMTLSGVNNREQFSLDSFRVSFHGYQHTHMDALCHMFWNGKMYNGFPQEEVTQKGAAKLAIQNLKRGIFTRGVLMDIPRLKGAKYLEPGTPIYPEDLEAWEKKAGLKLTAGDAVFIRTGRWARRAEKGPWDVSANLAGLHASCAKWLKARDVALLGSDAASDVLPSGVEGLTHPIHQLALVALGVNIFDNCDLEALSEAAAKRNRWEFLLTAAPIPLTGGTGSPLNPVATF
ncbi:MAG TPA: cyclase family protein [Blastocatellia bacterium]|jgi:kynurenine formamidase|nr:cyclase family protein [Blastocatellia bacterium]